MKTVRSTTKALDIQRVTDGKAAKLVASGDYAYCSKRIWKELIRDAPASVKDH